MKILITGANGFIGKNLYHELINQGYKEIYVYDIDSTKEELEKYCKNADFVFHLAGVNRPKDHSEFMKGNFGFTSELLDTLKKYNNKAPIMLSSSIQATENNEYGKSKKAGEELLLEYGKKENVNIYIYRFPNVFGKWSKPNYNSVIATFSHNISRNIPIQINNKETKLNLIYIDDLVKELVNCLEGKPKIKDGFCFVEPIYTKNLGFIADMLYEFKRSRENIYISNMSDEFTKKLYSTYLSYLPEEEFIYDLKMNIDNRGSFTEFIRTKERGQVSINVAKPGITKGNHWHHTKNEKFLVVSGEGLISFRKIDEDKIIEYRVSGEKLQVVDIPPGYTHNIKNIGQSDLITVMWVNEPFDKENPDTYFEGVEK